MEALAADGNAARPVSVEHSAPDASVEERKPDVKALSEADPSTEAVASTTVADQPGSGAAVAAPSATVDATQTVDATSKSTTDTATLAQNR